MFFLFALIMLGAIAFTIWTVSKGAGRDKILQRTPPQRHRAVRRPAQRPTAPDDDPEFLRSLADQVRKNDRDDPPTA